MNDDLNSAFMAAQTAPADNEVLSLLHYLILYREYVVLTAIALTVFLVWKNREAVSFMWLRFVSRLPVVGLISRYSRNIREDRYTGWFHAETEMCGRFYAHYINLHGDKQHFKDEYRRCNQYLNKAYELNRKSMPVWIWALLIVLTFAEAWGFSYAVAGWTVPSASEALQQNATYGIALLTALVLVIVTKMAGQEWYQNQQKKRVRYWYAESSNSNQKLAPDSHISLENDDLDNNESNWKQLVNRLPVDVQVLPGYGKITLAVVLVLTIGIVATYLRIQVLEMSIIEDRAIATASVAPVAAGGFDPLGGASATSVADATASENIERHGGIATYVVLGLLYLGIQAIGFYLGCTFGFYGKESARAARIFQKYHSAEEYWQKNRTRQERIVNVAQSHLDSLQYRLSERVRARGLSKEQMDRAAKLDERDFLDFVLLQAQENTEHRCNMKALREQDTAAYKSPENTTKDAIDKMTAQKDNHNVS